MKTAIHTYTQKKWLQMKKRDRFINDKLSVHFIWHENDSHEMISIDLENIQ